MNVPILLVDDETGILEMLELVLNKEGFTNIIKAGSGRQALEAVRTFEPKLIILDVMLPDTSGFEFCAELRKTTDVPILFLTAKTSSYDKLVGFATGGDDYITKPFDPLEVVARVKVQLRHQRMYAPGPHSERLVFADFQINKTSCEVTCGGTRTEFTAIEYELLLFFAEHPNRIFTTAQLYEQVWGQLQMGDDKTVVMHISKIRRKIEPDSSSPKYIVNVRGLGYKFIPHAPGREIR
ncbi:response regulator [Paenibacillus sp. CN-4]|uniref:response regulator n=1 Tax=Paenibacillus nanchangensis TaxID=3348343 RepID=UPI00397A13EC